jgi:hypothetical protein
LRKNAIRIAYSAIILAAAMGLSGAGDAKAASAAQMCADQWKQAKAAGTTNGMTRKDFVAQCKAQQDAGAPAAAPAAAPAPAPMAPAPAAAAGGKSAKDCSAEYSANKDAIKASGQKKKDFIAACRSGAETVPPPAAAAPAPMAPAPAPAPMAAPAAPAPAPMAAPAPAAPKSMAAPTGAGQFQTDAEAKGRCPTDTVVWLNTKSGVYHFAGTRDYGHTEHGAYMCEADAKAAGDRAARNEKHP